MDRKKSPVIMRGRLKAIGTYVFGMPKNVDPYEQSEWQRGYERAEVEIGQKLRHLLSDPVPGYHAENPSVQTRAKRRFIEHMSHKAGMDYEALSAEEKAKWEAYIENGVAYKIIRDENPFEDEFEYAPQSTYAVSGQVFPVYPEDWDTREAAQKNLDEWIKDNEERAARGASYFTCKLVKRRKSGPVTDA